MPLAEICGIIKKHSFWDGKRRDFAHVSEMNRRATAEMAVAVRYAAMRLTDENGIEIHSEVYRSGHNGPDSKSGSPHGLVGSNPTASATSEQALYRLLRLIL